MSELPGMWEESDLSGGWADVTGNAATGPNPATAEDDPTQGAGEGHGAATPGYLKGLQRHNLDRLGRLKAQGVEVPPYVLIDLKLEALKMRLGLSKDTDLGITAEEMLTVLLDQVESQVSKARLTQGIPNLRLK